MYVYWTNQYDWWAVCPSCYQNTVQLLCALVCMMLAKCMLETLIMHIMQVHGGTTERDIAGFIEKAEQESSVNKSSGVDTVVFFDEANTTDAIGLIKEIMCDRRINGKPVSDDLKFIAACNPYRKFVFCY